MKMRIFRKQVRKQSGFTLVEMLIALVISGIIISGAAGSLFQLIRNTAPANNRAQAVNSVQNAADWISRDGRNAKTVTLNANYPTFTWWDNGFSDDAHKTTVTYSLAGNKLMRSYQYSVQASMPNVFFICDLTMINMNTLKAILQFSPKGAADPIINAPSNSSIDLAPSISTDKDDYAPGEIVSIAGKGFGYGEIVFLYLSGKPNGTNFQKEIQARADGAFVAYLQLPEWVEDSYLLTATGKTSGLMARATFTDAAAPGLSSITPSSKTVGETSFTLTATGSGFNSGSKIRFAGVDQTTTYVSSTTLTATIPASNLTAAGTFAITVYRYSDGKGSGSKNFTVNKASTSTGIISSLNPSGYGQSVTFTAIMSVTAPGSGTPTGTVTFKDGSSTLGSAILASGQATYTTSTLAKGNHNITAVYGGDSNFNTSTSTILSQVVNMSSTATQLSSSSNPSPYGQPVTFTATVTPGASTGTIQFKIDGANFGSPVTLTGGAAVSNANSSLSVGNHSVTAVYSGDTNFNGSSGTLSGGQTVSLATANITVTSSVNPSFFSQSVSFTATLSPGSATGTVQFKIDGANFGSPVTLSGGTAVSNATISILVGNHPVTAVYSGDSYYNGNTGTLSGGQTVGPAPSGVSLVSSVNPSLPGQPVAFTATVTPGAATGSVQFKIDGANFGSPAVLSAGSTSSGSISTLALGNHTVTADYNGDSYYGSSTGSLSGGQMVAQLPTTTSVSSSKNPSVPGDLVTFTATVSPGAATGTVQFTLDGVNFGSPVTLSGGSAISSATFTLSIGNHPVTAVYSGDTIYATSNGTLSGGEIVSLTATTTSLVSSKNPASYGDAVTFTATVIPGDVTGTIQFKIDGSNFGSPVSISAGRAVTNASSALSVGNHSVTAVYSGDSYYATSSGSLNGGQNIYPAGVSLPVSNSVVAAYNISLSNASLDSNTGTLTLTITALAGSGSQQYSEAKTYKIAMRNYKP